MNKEELEAVEDTIIKEITATIDDLSIMDREDLLTYNEHGAIWNFLENIVHKTNKHLQEKHVNLQIVENFTMI